MARGWWSSAHDISEGGLAVALAECCIAGVIGAEVFAQQHGGISANLIFGEAGASVLVSVRKENEQALKVIFDMLSPEGHAGSTLCLALGKVGGNSLVIEDTRSKAIDLPVEQLRDTYEGAIPKALEGAVPELV